MASPAGFWSDEQLRRYAERVLGDREARMAGDGRGGGAWAPLEAVWVSLTGSVGSRAPTACARATAEQGDGSAVHTLVRHLVDTFRRREISEDARDAEGRPLPTAEDQRLVRAALGAVYRSESNGAVDTLVAEAWGRLWDLREERLDRVDEAAVVRALTCCDLDRAARQHPRLLVVGEPGSGKTTLLSHLANLAAEGLRAGGNWLSAGEPAPLPVFVRLSRVAELLPASGPPPSGVVSQAVTEAVARLGLPTPRLADALAGGAVFVLLDALDEVACDTARPRVAEAVAAFARDVAPGRLVLTTRPDALRDGGGEAKHLQPLLSRADLHDLGRAQVRRLLGRWLVFLARRRGLDEAEAARVASQQLARGLQHLDRNPESWHIARRPITLVMLARVLKEADGDLPARPTELYERCVRSLAWLLDVEERETLDQVKVGPSHPVLGGLGHDHRLRILERVAWGILEQGGAAELSAGKVRGVIRGVLGRQDGDTAAMDAVAAALASRSGLLVSGARGWSFAHRELRDYLAARHAAGDEVERAATTARELLARRPERLHAPWWRPVAVFAPGAALAKHGDGEAARDVALALAEAAVLVPDDAARADAMSAVADGLLDLRAAGVGGLEIVAAHLRAASERALTNEAQPGAVEGRFLLARVLGVWGDGRLAPGRRWVEVPGGGGWRGAAPGDGGAYDDEQPGHRVVLSGFLIQRWCVTVGEYAAFVDAGGYDAPRWWHPEGWTWREAEAITSPAAWERQRPGPRNLPVVGASWWEADAFCRWVTQDPTARAAWGVPEGDEVRLPTDAEWERAARGGEDIDGGVPAAVRIWPWGRDEDPHRALVEGTPGLAVRGYRRDGPEPVGCFPAGHGPYETWDQAGNVWEWCLDAWAEEAYRGAQPPDPVVLGTGLAPEPYRTWRDHHALSELPAADRRVVRGGSFGFQPGWLRASCRSLGVPRNRVGARGFRCVVSPAGRVLVP